MMEEEISASEPGHHKEEEFIEKEFENLKGSKPSLDFFTFYYELVSNSVV